MLLFVTLIPVSAVTEETTVKKNLHKIVKYLKYIKKSGNTLTALKDVHFHRELLSLLHWLLPEISIPFI